MIASLAAGVYVGQNIPCLKTREESDALLKQTKEKLQRAEAALEEREKRLAQFEKDLNDLRLDIARRGKATEADLKRIADLELAIQRGKAQIDTDEARIEALERQLEADRQRLTAQHQAEVAGLQAKLQTCSADLQACLSAQQPPQPLVCPPGYENVGGVCVKKPEEAGNQVYRNELGELFLVDNGERRYMNKTAYNMWKRLVNNKVTPVIVDRSQAELNRVTVEGADIPWNRTGLEGYIVKCPATSGPQKDRWFLIQAGKARPFNTAGLLVYQRLANVAGKPIKEKQLTCLELGDFEVGEEMPNTEEDMIIAQRDEQVIECDGNLYYVHKGLKRWFNSTAYEKFNEKFPFLGTAQSTCALLPIGPLMPQTRAELNYMFGPKTPIKTRTDYEGGESIVSCPVGQVVNVVGAKYGAANCESATAPAIVKSECQGKTSCRLQVSNSTFGNVDPCPNVTKALEVAWTCDPPPATRSTRSLVSSRQRSVCPPGYENVGGVCVVNQVFRTEWGGLFLIENGARRYMTQTAYNMWKRLVNNNIAPVIVDRSQAELNRLAEGPDVPWNRTGLEGYVVTCPGESITIQRNHRWFLIQHGKARPFNTEGRTIYAALAGAQIKEKVLTCLELGDFEVGEDMPDTKGEMIVARRDNQVIKCEGLLDAFYYVHHGQKRYFNAIAYDKFTQKFPFLGPPVPTCEALPRGPPMPQTRAELDSMFAQTTRTTTTRSLFSRRVNSIKRQPPRRRIGF